MIDSLFQKLRKRMQYKVRKVFNLDKVRKVFNLAPYKWLSIQDYNNKYPSRWYPAYPAQDLQWKPPIQYGAQAINDFERRLADKFPELGVLEINNGLLLTNNGWVFGTDNYFLPEFSWHGLDFSIINLPKPLPKVTKLKGVCLSITSTWGSSSYGHFLIDSLCRFKIFLEAGFTLSDVDYVLCPTPPSPNAERILEKLKIPESKIIWARGNIAVQADVVLAPSFPGVRRNNPRWAADFLRELTNIPSTTPNRRLYVTRVGKTRNVVNLDALEAMLREYDFEIYDPVLDTDQPADFGAAEIVIGPQGSALANLAFCQPGTRVMELYPSDHLYPYNYTLSQSGGLEYGYLIGKSIGQRKPSASGPSPYDFLIDENEFFTALKQMTKDAQSRFQGST